MYRKSKLPAVLAMFAVLACSDVSPTGPGRAPTVTPSLDEVQVVTEPTACDQLKTLVSGGQITQADYDSLCGLDRRQEAWEDACLRVLLAGPATFEPIFRICLLR